MDWSYSNILLVILLYISSHKDISVLASDGGITEALIGEFKQLLDQKLNPINEELLTINNKLKGLAQNINDVQDPFGDMNTMLLFLAQKITIVKHDTDEIKQSMNMINMAARSLEESVQSLEKSNEVETVCDPTCVNGDCTAPNTCTCDEGWSGYTCNEAVCDRTCIHGDCTAPNTCTCAEGWSGDTCNEGTCPPLFRKLGEQCLRVLLGPAEDRTYHQALGKCQHLGGTLAQLQDTSHIIRYISTDLGKGNWKFWVGATWNNKKEGFRWFTSGKKVTNWEDGQPDNGGIKVFDWSDEHCVEIQAWNAKYNDQDCDKKRSFICEVDLIVSWRNCDDVREYKLLHTESPPSGIRQIFPYEDNKNKGVLVFCDLITAGGGWTVIQHRDDYVSGLMDFNKLWQDYKDGFGDVEK
ncbi:unnamed protein product, partial [Meganyctiphanes norvegica]